MPARLFGSVGSTKSCVHRPCMQVSTPSRLPWNRSRASAPRVPQHLGDRMSWVRQLVKQVRWGEHPHYVAAAATSWCLLGPLPWPSLGAPLGCTHTCTSAAQIRAPSLGPLPVQAEGMGLGIEFHWESRLLGVDLQRRLATIQHRDGAPETLAYDLLLGADGANSAVRALQACLCFLS